MFVDLALDNMVFHHLPSLIFTASSFTKEEFYQRRMHTIVTDFLTLMPLKIKVSFDRLLLLSSHWLLSGVEKQS